MADVYGPAQDILILIALFSSKDLGMSMHWRTHQSLCCSHMQSMDVDEDVDDLILKICINKNVYHQHCKISLNQTSKDCNMKILLF